MVPKKSHQGVRVLITTYKADLNKAEARMELQERHAKTNTNKFVCSICLSGKDINHGKVLCNACQRSDNNINKDFNKDTNKHEDIKHAKKANKDKHNVNDHNAKSLIKQQTDFSQGLNLLNEVLTVFKSKKQNLQSSNSSKTLVFKDVSTSTDNDSKPNAKPKLVISKVFLCSIEGHKDNENCKFTVVNSSQPEYFKKECIIDLKKHKSSSIPQMRIDELKNSLKEKTKSRDVNEEVNRMFATVTMNSINKASDHINRPVTRKGPRVLPVVKTDTKQNQNLRQTCKCCQASKHCLSSGDSFVEPKVNQKRLGESHYKSYCQKNHRVTQTDVVVCQNCRNVTEICCHCEKSFPRNCYENIG